MYSRQRGLTARTAQHSRRKKTAPRSSAPSASDLLALLQAAQLSPTQLRQVTRRYGSSTGTALRAHPYRLVHDIDGIAFAQADTVARRLGRGKEDRERIRAGIQEILQQGLRGGHTCLPLPRVVARTARLLQVSPTVIEEQCLRGALEVGGSFVVDHQGPETLLALIDIRRSEERVAQALTDRLHLPLPPLVPDLDAVTQPTARRRGLNAQQQQALRAALSCPLTVITGGPGTGKSYFCQALAEVATQYHIPLLAGAPTGRAAQRLTEVAGLPAATLHRLLEYQPGDGTFLRNADLPLMTSVLIVDEASMLDLWLFDKVLDALPLGARLVLIGDVDQLPSVGPGQVLADVIASGIAQTVRLTQLYRRSPESLITVNAHRVRDGQLPRTTTELQADFRFIEEGDPERAIARVVDLVAQEIPVELGVDPRVDVQVLAPLNIGPIGTQALNRALQLRLNPDGRQVRVSPETEFRVGDRLVVTANNYRLNIFNGDCGTLVRADPARQVVVLRTGKDEARFVGPELSALTLGYAVSVHRAQGGEFPVVVVVLHDLHAPLLQRTLLYTAITRAKRLCVIVGTHSALTQAVNNIRSLHRHTGLVKAIFNTGFVANRGPTSALI